MVGVACLVEIGGMASRTLGRRSCISCRMALDTIGLYMGTRQREIRIGMVEHIVRIARRMASKASRIFIHIPVHAGVRVVGFRVNMATGTRIFGVIRCIGMAIRTLGPLSFVFPAVNREISGIVHRKRSRHPVRIGGMALRTIIRKMGSLVVRSLCRVVILLMASCTGCWSGGIITPRMTFVTIAHFMSQR